MARLLRRAAARVSRLTVDPVQRALTSTPPPEPPIGWVQRVLADLVAVDIERWRRFDGIIERVDEHDGERWALELRHGSSVDWEPGGMATWWRGGLNGTVPELLGTLTIGGARPGDDVASLIVPVSVDLVRSRRGVEATLTMRGTGLKLQEESYSVIAPAHAPAGAGVCAVVEQTCWSGFPGPATDVRPNVPLDRVVGATVCLHDLGDLVLEPDELLLTAAAPGSESILLMRLAADEPMKDQMPDSFADGTWNAANGIDMDYVVDAAFLETDVLTLSGEGWLVKMSGRNLRVTVEQLG